MFSFQGGPLLGLFCLGIFIPFANPKGAFAGTISGISFTIWIFTGLNAYGIKYPKKPFYTFGCNNTLELFNNTALSFYNATAQPSYERLGLGQEQISCPCTSKFFFHPLKKRNRKLLFFELHVVWLMCRVNNSRDRLNCQPVNRYAFIFQTNSDSKRKQARLHHKIFFILFQAKLNGIQLIRRL